MLMQLKNKQRKNATIALSAFIGSWLLLLCQACFASDNDSKSHHEPVVEVTTSCHTPETIELEEINLENDEHCLGVCDCDAMTVTFSSDKNFELKEKTKYSPDIYSYVSPEINILTRAPPNYRISSIPERAILLPLQTYNVLLI
jgi:iron only hydrogenase large subunit-like protein